MNNTTANDTTNQSGYWQPIDVSNLPDVGQIINDVESGIIEMLTNWDLDPFHTVFCLLIVAILFLIMSQLFVNVTSKSSGVFKPVMYLVVLIVLLLLLGVI